MSYSAEGFLATIKPWVIEDMKRTKILASLTASQALIESNKGNSGLAVKGNNLFGIKGKYNGESVRMETTEYYNGVPTRVMADFRKYPSWAESIADHSALFNTKSRYANLRGLTNYKLACQFVREDGYATSPTYTNTLINCIEKYRLYSWDEEAQGNPTGNPYPVPEKSIKLNSKGNGVRWLQVCLNRHGYGLIVDGIAGEKSISALKDYQSKHSLVPDGICGALTKAVLLSE